MIVYLALVCFAAASQPDSLPSSQPISQAEPLPASDEAGAFDVFNIIEEQEQTVVTGSTKETTLRESPTNVWLLDRKTLDRQPMLTLYDALRMVPGINIIE